MNRISEVFQTNLSKNEGVLIPFITAGDPNFETSLEIAHTLFGHGADILELGIPFSDPIADGPTIQASSQRALEAGMTPKKAMKLVNSLRDEGPLVFMTYYNIVLQYGLTKFVVDSKKHGIDGIIIPDLPIEESDPLLHECEKCDIALIFMIAPTTDPARMKQIIDRSKGYVYLVSTLGVTGAKENVAEHTKLLIHTVKEISQGKIPLAVGFGISKPEHVTELIDNGADGIIVGSAIINKIRHDSLSELEDFVSDLKRHTKKLRK